MLKVGFTRALQLKTGKMPELKKPKINSKLRALIGLLEPVLPQSNTPLLSIYNFGRPWDVAVGKAVITHSKSVTPIFMA